MFLPPPLSRLLTLFSLEFYYFCLTVSLRVALRSLPHICLPRRQPQAYTWLVLSVQDSKLC